MEQSNSTSKIDIAKFAKKADFADKLKNLDKNVTSNKANDVFVEEWIKWTIKKSWININKRTNQRFDK